MDNGQNVELVENPSPVAFWRNLLAGGIAGTTVDVGLFPIDTIKTRMQAPQGLLMVNSSHVISDIMRLSQGRRLQRNL